MHQHIVERAKVLIRRFPMPLGRSPVSGVGIRFTLPQKAFVSVALGRHGVLHCIIIEKCREFNVPDEVFGVLWGGFW